MFPKRVIAGLSLLTLATVVIIAGERNCRAQGQSVPNVIGTWELVEYDGITQRQVGSKFPKVTLVISQTASEIKITEKRTRRGAEQTHEFTYYTDGRGETNTGQIKLWSQDEHRTESVTQWHEGKLLTRYKRQVRVMPSYALKSTSSDAKEEWRLTSDGKKLVLTASTTQMDSSSTASHDQSDLAPKASFFRNKLVFRKVS
jgi:hypothetical protein